MILVVLLGAPFSLSAQVDFPGTGMGGFGSFGSFGANQNFGDPNNDSLKNKSKKWTNPAPMIYYKHWNSEVKHNIDTSLNTVHHFDSAHTWSYNLGNIGTAEQSFLFHSSRDIGPRLQYRQYQQLFYSKQSIPFFNTTRPYSLFNYSMGSQQEQTVSLIHTQNFNPRLNVAVQVKNLNSPGFFNNFLAVNNSSYISSNYISLDQKYKLQAGFIYNRVRNDENGGIINDSLLIENNFINTKQIPTLIGSLPSNRRRSRISNSYRDAHVFLSHEYRVGDTDSIYNEDSTKLQVLFKPEWSFRHDMDISFKKHFYEDKVPNVNNYTFIDPDLQMLSNDTVWHDQRLNTVQNNFSINGYIGKIGQQLQIEAGIGNRIDQLKNVNKGNDNSTTYVNNYIFGQIRKEALVKTQWSFGANAQFYFAGSHIGNLNVDGYISKYFDNIGSIHLSAGQTVSSPANNFTDYRTNFFVITNDFNKISHTQFQGSLDIEKLGLKLILSNHLIYNYVYLSPEWNYRQFDELLNVTNITVNHNLKVKRLNFISEGFFQQSSPNAPVNLPSWGLSETISYSNALYTNKLQFVTGLQARYISPYQRIGYSYLFNQFHFNNESVYQDNRIELKAFINFKVKNLRFYIVGDQIQQLIWKKNVSYVMHYPLQSTMYRFGFKWTLYN